MLTSGGTELGQVDIRRGMFQGDSLSPLLLTVVILPLILELRKIILDRAGLSLIFRAPVAKKVHSYSSYSGGFTVMRMRAVTASRIIRANTKSEEDNNCESKRIRL